jgi:hypothetical protein
MHALHTAEAGNVPTALRVNPLTIPAPSPELRVVTAPSPALPAGPYWIGDRDAAKASGATAKPAWVADVPPGVYHDHHGYAYLIRTALVVVPWKRTEAAAKLQRKTLHDRLPAGRVVHFWRPVGVPVAADPDVRVGCLTIRRAE